LSVGEFAARQSADEAARAVFERSGFRMCSCIPEVSDDDFAGRVGDDQLIGGRNGERVEREFRGRGLNEAPSARKIRASLSAERCRNQHKRGVRGHRRSHDPALTPRVNVCSPELFCLLISTF
jgi:hypothetical protein